MCEILAAALIKHLNGTEKCEIEGQARDYGTKILLKHTPISEHFIRDAEEGEIISRGNRKTSKCFTLSLLSFQILVESGAKLAF